MSNEARLTKLGIQLPPPPQPAGAYTRAVRSGKLLFVSGQLPMTEGAVKYSGHLGLELDLQAGQEAARLCALNALSVVRAEAGSLDNVVQIVRLAGYVSCVAEFTEQALVVNGASECMAAVFGDAGVHARVAVGCCALPLGAAVELELIAELS
jgi:enamine deaminase RidA (YjgF/YER057c/UK114 family)